MMKPMNPRIAMIKREDQPDREQCPGAVTYALLIMMVVRRAGGIIRHFAEKDVWDGGMMVANLQLPPGSKMGALP
jgi:hypothetical protein